MTWVTVWNEYRRERSNDQYLTCLPAVIVTVARATR